MGKRAFQSFGFFWNFLEVHFMIFNEIDAIKSDGKGEEEWGEGLGNFIICFPLSFDLKEF